MKKISLALMTILAAAAFTCCSPEPTENTKDNSSETEQPAGEDTTDPGTTDPGTTDPGTTDPGTTDPGTTDPVEEPKLAVNLTLSVLETGYARIKFSGNTEVKNQKDEIVRTEFYWIASDGTVPAAKDLVEKGTQCKFYSYSPTEEASSHSEEFALSRLAIDSEYHFVATATVDETVFYSEVKTVSTDNIADIPETVDMGTGLKWRGWNLGASAPEEFGNYYSWGEIAVKSDYSDTKYKFYGPYSTFSKYTTANGDGVLKGGTPDNRVVLDLEDDAAAQNLEHGWRIPTKEEAEALVAACNKYWTSLRGVEGCLLESKENGAVLFLPGAGYMYGQGSSPSSKGQVMLWTSTLYDGDNKMAYQLYSGLDYYGQHKLNVSTTKRYDGHPIRPVLTEVN